MKNSPKFNPVKKAETVPKGRAPNPFPRRKIKIPVEIQNTAALWLEFYQEMTISMLGMMSGGEATAKQRMDLVKEAADLATEMVNQYEARWPGVKP